MTIEKEPILRFEDASGWAEWLKKNHQASTGVWLELAKKDSKVKTHSYAEALEIALCHGWIDGQRKGKSEHTFLQRFSPRGPRSIWSQINRRKAEDLIEAGRMKPAGLKAVESARQDGRWARAYKGQKTATVPRDLQKALDQNPAAKAFFSTLDSKNRYAILFRVQLGKKPETRARKIAGFVEMLSKKKKIHP